MRGRRKYQARKLYDSASSEIKNNPLVGNIRYSHAITSKNENLKAALFGDLKDRPGAMLAIEIRTLAKLRKYLATLPDDEREQEEIEHNVIQRTGAAKFRLSIAAERSGGRFFKDFADGIAFFNSRLEQGSCADPVATYCLQYESLEGMEYAPGMGNLTHLHSMLAKEFDDVPDIREVGRLCKILGVKLDKGKSGRKSNPIK